MFSLKDSEFVSSYTLKDYKNVNVSWLKTFVILYLVLHQVWEKLLHTFTFFLNVFFLLCLIHYFADLDQSESFSYVPHTTTILAADIRSDLFDHNFKT